MFWNVSQRRHSSRHSYNFELNSCCGLSKFPHLHLLVLQQGVEFKDSFKSWKVCMVFHFACLSASTITPCVYFIYTYIYVSIFAFIFPALTSKSLSFKDLTVQCPNSVGAWSCTPFTQFCKTHIFCATFCSWATIMMGVKEEIKL